MKYDVAIIGCGIVGLATAFQLLSKRKELKVVVFEKEATIAKHQTGNNSGVIHSGVYYKPGSEKAKNCKRGYQMLLDFCNEENINYELCGKVIVATKDKELPILQNIYERGIQNGLKGLKFLNPAELKEKEPHLFGIKGIWVPQAGIIDYKLVALKYAEKVESLGGEIKLGHKVTNILSSNNELNLETSKGDFSAKLIVNCGGLYSDKIAMMSGQATDFKIIPFRGEYYDLKPNKTFLVNGLIYPVPNPSFPFLGVHFTKMIHGGVEAGPNAVLAFKREGYKNTQFDFKEFVETITYRGFLKIAAKYWKDGAYEMYRSYSKTAFVKAMKTLVPSITSDDVVKGGAGVRAQACTSKGHLVDDFLILEKGRVINVCNAPSPAATSSLSIGQTISEKIISKLN
jgi:L-2-hydroxyglutarate oxidase